MNKLKLTQLGKLLQKTGDSIIIGNYYAARLNTDNIENSPEHNFDGAVKAELESLKENCLVSFNYDVMSGGKTGQNENDTIIDFMRTFCDFSQIIVAYFENKFKSTRMQVNKSDMTTLKVSENDLKKCFDIDRIVKDLYILRGTKPSLKTKLKNKNIMLLCWNNVTDIGNVNEANKYFFGTENTNEVKKMFESRDFDSDVIDGKFFYKQFDVWAKELDKFLLKFNVISLRKYMKSRRLVSGMDTILRMYAEIVEENNPWPSKYVDQILTDYLDNIEESITNNCKKGLVHMCELLGITPSRDTSENLMSIYAFGN